MRRRAIRALAAGPLAAVLVATSALADDAQTQWYGSVTGMRTMPSDSGAELGTALGTGTGDIELSDEMGFALAVGFETTGGQRVELEAAFRSSDIEGANDVRLNSIPVPPSVYRLNGDVDTWSLMVNVRQVIDVGPVRPYVGGGLGFARHDGTAALAVGPRCPQAWRASNPVTTPFSPTSSWRASRSTWPRVPRCSAAIDTWARRTWRLSASQPASTRTPSRQGFGFGSEHQRFRLRLTHHVHILEMNSESYRLNHSRARTKATKT